MRATDHSIMQQLWSE